MLDTERHVAYCCLMPSRAANGPAIRAIREALGISLRTMADEISTPAPHLSRVERGERGASPALIRAISVRLGVPVDAITHNELVTTGS